MAGKTAKLFFYFKSQIFLTDRRQRIPPFIMKNFFYLRTKSGLFPLNTSAATAFESYCHFENIEIKKDLIRPGHIEISSEKYDLIKEFFEFSTTFWGWSATGIIDRYTED